MPNCMPIKRCLEQGRQTNRRLPANERYPSINLPAASNSRRYCSALAWLKMSSASTTISVVTGRADLPKKKIGICQ